MSIPSRKSIPESRKVWSIDKIQLSNFSPARVVPKILPWFQITSMNVSESWILISINQFQLIWWSDLDELSCFQKCRLWFDNWDSSEILYDRPWERFLCLSSPLEFALSNQPVEPKLRNGFLLHVHKQWEMREMSMCKERQDICELWTIKGR